MTKQVLKGLNEKLEEVDDRLVEMSADADKNPQKCIDKFAQLPKGQHFSYFRNEKCEYFPCHQDADSENHNCLFCYCPLYMLGDKCGGTFQYTKSGWKDCSNCILPHLRENYEYVTEKCVEMGKHL